MLRAKFERLSLMLLCLFGLMCCAASVWYAWQSQSARRFNAELTSVLSGQALTSSGSARQRVLLKIAYAEKLRSEGKETEALTVLRDVEAESQVERDDVAKTINTQAKFNSANIYLRQAMDLLSRGERAKALPPTELAKGLYRDVLRADSQAWDARYNLERALVIFPEAVSEEDEAMALPPPGERAVTTMRGVSPGLP